jgi:hypothetical protein
MCFSIMDTVCRSYRDLKIRSNSQKGQSQSQSQQVKLNDDINSTSCLCQHDVMMTSKGDVVALEDDTCQAVLAFSS